MKCTRRSFLRLAAGAAGAALLAACQPQATATQPPATEAQATSATETQPTEAPEPAAMFEGKIQMWFQSYNPSADMEKSEDNPLPHNLSLVLSQEYMEAHPGVTIEIVELPANVDSREWIVTQQAGGTVPHIVWCPAAQWVEGDIGKGWWVPLDEYFDEPNPYIEAGQPGADRWRDEFYEIPFETKRMADGKVYVVPFDLVTTFFFYNKDIFKEVGVEAPSTWSEWLDAQAKLTAAGYPVSYWAYGGQLFFYPNQVGAMIYAQKEPDINPDGGVATQEEIGCAIQKGIYRASNDEYKEWLALTKKLIPFISPDWAAAGIDNNNKFLNKEVSVLEDGSWRFGLLRANPLVPFEWGTFYAPTLTDQDSPFSINKTAPPVGGATSLQLAITGRAEQENQVPLCVDILRFYSAPQNAGRMIDEMGQFLPNIKGVDVNPELKGPLEAVSTGVGEAGMITYPDKIGLEFREKIARAWTDWFLDQTSLEKTQELIDDYMSEYVTAATEQFGWQCS